MTLDAWRISNNWSYETLARKLNFTTSKVYRLCCDPRNLKLNDAKKIVEASNGMVKYTDLITEKEVV
jgi:hypothetical protein